ncbi:uncharacterized protein LOC142504851 [Primulina tabacum]|uniref:uncharacterized protein LOC142504851 n=1 Tax=Primulina tabacum TaxID=48773 RepID=UPI003F5A7D72
MTSFTVVDSPSSYNIILGRPAMNELRAVASTYHQKIKFPVGTQSKNKREGKKARVNEVGGRVVERGEVHFVAEEEQEMIEVGPGQQIRVARDLSASTPVSLINCLKANIHVFAWSQQELTWISPLISEHQLNILPGSHLVKQKKRHFVPEKDKVIDEQVKELLKAGHIRDIQFPTWLSNVVLVPKSTGKWRMYVDLRDLNKACPKDHYPLSRIDQLVDSTSGFELLSFMDAYTRGIIKSPWPRVIKIRPASSPREDLKIHLAELPVLVKPEPREKLFVYLSTTEYAVSSVLIKEEGSDQKLIYYISHALRGPELWYSEVEKISLALIMTARKLRPYFLSHQIIVLTNSPLGRIMTHSEVFGRMIKWTVELGEYDIKYKPRVAIKAQALSDSLPEMVQPNEEEVWRVFVDGSSSLAGCGVGVVIISLPREKIKLALKMDFRVTTNEAEYEAVLADKDDMILKYLQLIKARAEVFADWGIEQIPREENGEADTLAKMAAPLSEVSTRKVLHVSRLILSTEEEILPTPEDSWMTPIIKFISNKEISEDKARAQKIKRQAPRDLF